MKKKLLVHGTFGKENPEKATLPFIVGNVAATSDQDVIVFLTSEGVRLATKGYADDVHKEGFQPTKQLIEEYVANGGIVWACGACTNPRGITEADLIKGAKIVTAVNLIEYMQEATAINF
jgi:uncharacterized protein